MPYKDVPAFMAQLRTVKGVSVRALELAILTATCSKETREAPFHEFNLDAKLWTIPAEPHETRARSSRAVIAPSPSSRRWPRPGATSIVFPGREPGEQLSDMAMSVLLREMCSTNKLPCTVSDHRSAIGRARKQTFHDICEVALARAIWGR